MSTSARSVHEMTSHTYALTTEAHVGVALSGRLAPVRRSSMLRALTGMWIVSVGGVCGMCVHQGWLKLDCHAQKAVCEQLVQNGALHAPWS